MKTYPEQSRNFNQLSRLELLPITVEAALRCVERWGVEENFNGVAGPVLSFKSGSFSILYRTPKTMAPGAPASFGIDIWYENKKAFSACWNSHALKDFDLIALKRGPWVSSLLEMATSAGET